MDAICKTQENVLFCLETKTDVRYNNYTIDKQIETKQEHTLIIKDQLEIWSEISNKHI